MSELESVKRLTRDLASAAATLSHAEARYLVDAYYQMQKNRIVAGNQILAQSKQQEPHDVLKWLWEQNETLENQIKRALDKWTDGHTVGQWLKEITGIGPVIAAGLLAHIDIKQAPTAGHIWRFAGLDPTREWLGADKASKLVKQSMEDSRDLLTSTGANVESNGDAVLQAALMIAARIVNIRPEKLRHMATHDRDGNEVPLTTKTLQSALAKRPYNSRLKVLCWKIGESFVKVSTNPKDVYGKLYLQRKAYEQEKNNKFEYAERAEKILATKNIGKATDAYKSYIEGKLPPAHIHSRSKRWAVKIFLSHLHEFWYKVEFQKEPPAPYPIAILGHAHKIEFRATA